MGSRRWRRRILRGLPWLVLLVLGTALAVQLWMSFRDVLVYSAADPEIAEPLLGDVNNLSRMKVGKRYEAQIGRQVNLAQCIVAEAGHPRCDVFWNDEILQTLRLAHLGVLAPYESPNAADFPAQYRPPDKLWQSFALRPRVLLVDSRGVERARRPRSVRDLTNAAWRGKCAMVKPLSGTAATHLACLVTLWGDEQTRRFLRQLKENQVQLLPTERDVARAVARGAALFGLVDSDRAAMEQSSQLWLEIVYPDQGEGDPGTLFLPNTLSIVRDCPHPESAARLIDQLLSVRTATVMSKGAGALVPLNSKAKLTQPRVQAPPAVRPMTVDFEAALNNLDAAVRIVKEEFPD